MNKFASKYVLEKYSPRFGSRYGRGSSGSVVVSAGPNAPILTWGATETSLPPDSIVILLSESLAGGWIIQLQFATEGTSFASPIVVQHTITQDDIDFDFIDFTGETNWATLPNDDYDLRARLSDGSWSVWSNTVQGTIAAGRQFAVRGSYINSSGQRQFAARGAYIAEVTG